MVLKPQFISDNIAEIKRICSRTSGITAVIGFVDRGKDTGIYNAAAVVSKGRIIDIYHKMQLPNYGVFDEFRYFRAGRRFPVYDLNNLRFGINICEDIWHRDGPARIQSIAGAEVIININASPYEKGKPGIREKILQERSSENKVMIAYLNAIGGQDELVFDGASMVFDHEGQLIARGKQFEEDMLVIDLDIEEVRKFRKEMTLSVRGKKRKLSGFAKGIKIPSTDHPGRKPIEKTTIQPLMSKDEEIYKALVLGTSDYVKKNGFNGVIIGLSGGVDSSLVAAIAADAIGKENVTGLFMPSKYTSSESREDAFLLAKNLGINIIEISIAGIMKGYLKVLEKSFGSSAKQTQHGGDTTEENLQARIRGNLLMAFSNKFGRLVLTTGNKSEMSVGYATLYGDMAGGFAVIKDVPKTLVYDICGWRNSIAGKDLIPDRVLWKEPTAELRPDQKDTDTLPPYPVLDPILKAYVEDEMSYEEILGIGCGKECTKKVLGMVDRSEYKRRQSPPGIKITARALEGTGVFQ
jgi:NAD+ synthase (glutamine-hydrolysing)